MLNLFYKTGGNVSMGFNPIAAISRHQEAQKPVVMSCKKPTADEKFGALMLNKLSQQLEPGYLTDTGFQCRQVIDANKPGIRHHLGKWILPPLAGVAAAGVTGSLLYAAAPYAVPALARFTGNLLLNTTKSLVSSTWENYGAYSLIAGTGAASIAVATGAKATQGIGLKNVTNVFLASFYTLAGAALFTMKSVGSMVSDNVKETFVQNEKAFPELKAEEEKKLVKSEKRAFKQMAKFLEKCYTEQSASRKEKIQSYVPEIEKKIQALSIKYKEDGIKTSDITKITRPLVEQLELIKQNL